MLALLLGVATLTSLLITAYIGFMNLNRRSRIHIKYHFMMAKISILLACSHAVIVILRGI